MTNLEPLTIKLIPQKMDKGMLKCEIYGGDELCKTEYFRAGSVRGNQVLTMLEMLFGGQND